jgi:hypothetical protein
MKQEVTAFWGSKGPQQAARPAHIKPDKFWKEWSALGVVADRIVPIVQARLYWAGTTAYCFVTIRHARDFAYGSAKAGGYGYDKASSALAHAFAAAGVGFQEGGEPFYFAATCEGPSEQAILAAARLAMPEATVLTFYVARG